MTLHKMTLHEFLNELRRLHCIEGYDIPELRPHRQAAFVRDPVQFLIRADDATAEAIWRAMERDRVRQGSKPMVG